jgi:hypothetical protein
VSKYTAHSGKSVTRKILACGSPIALLALVAAAEHLFGTHEGVTEAAGILTAFGVGALQTAHQMGATVEAVEIHEHHKTLEAEHARLANDDLARAVGVTLEVIFKKHFKVEECAKLWHTLADKASEGWVALSHDLGPELLGPMSEDRLVEAISQHSGSAAFPPLGQPELWRELLPALAEKCGIRPEALTKDRDFETMVQLCDTRFREQLYDTLKHDFQEGGKAFAGVALRALGETVFRLRRLEESQQSMREKIGIALGMMHQLSEQIARIPRGGGEAGDATLQIWAQDITSELDAQGRVLSDLLRIANETGAYLRGDELTKRIARSVVEEFARHNGHLLTLPPNNFPDVPLTPNRSFVGRRGELDDLHARLTRPRDSADTRADAVVHAVEGEGGIGKTELIQAYAFEAHREWAHRWWIDGSKETIDESCRKLARFLGLPVTGQTPGSEVRRQIRIKLEDGSRHLLLVDNAEPSNESEKGWSAIEELALQPPSRVLLTTRRTDLPHDLAEPFELGVLSKVDARNLLKTARADLKASVHDPALDAVAEYLGYLGLALGYAAAWLAAGRTRTPAALLTEIKKNELGDSHPLEDPALNRKAHRYQRSTYAALSLHLPDFANTPAMALLTAAAFCHPDRIPLELLAEAAGIDTGEAEHWLNQLANRSILHLEPSAATDPASEVRGWVRLHRLTQSMLRNRAWKQERPSTLVLLARLRKALVAVLSKQEHHSNFAARVRLTPHALALAHLLDAPQAELLSRNPLGLDQFDAAMLRDYLAQQLQYAGDLSGAAEQIDRIIEWGDRQGPSRERDVAIWCAIRASIRKDRGDLPGAEVDIRRSFEWGEAQTPRDERSLAIDYASRAGIRQSRGDLPGAEADIQRSIEWGEAQTPKDERGLAIDYARRAGIRQSRGDLPGAEADIQRSIDFYEAQTPRDARGLAILSAKRASIRKDHGDLPGAEVDIQRSIDFYEAQTPKTEQHLSICYGTRAEIYRLRGNLAEAEQYVQQSLDWEARQVRPNGRSVAYCHGYRADIFLAKNEWTKALADANFSIAWAEQQSTLDQRGLARWYKTKALAHEGAGQIAEAKVAIDRSVEYHTAVFTADHEWTKAAIALQQSIHINAARQ